MQNPCYHLGFGRSELGTPAARIALLSGDPARSGAIARQHFENPILLSDHRGLTSYLGQIGKVPVIAATSGMGAPSLSIVVNELVQLGIRTIIRVGTCGAIQPEIQVGDSVISSAALCLQGAALDIAPAEYPAVADPFLTVSLAQCARSLGIPHHVGITASVDTFYEGQARLQGASSFLQPHLRDRLECFRALQLLNFEMEAATLFKMGSVYGFSAGCVCAVIAARIDSENVMEQAKEAAIQKAIRIAIELIRNRDWEEGRLSRS
jgi:uridine phosphorylase